MPRIVRIATTATVPPGHYPTYQEDVVYFFGQQADERARDAVGIWQQDGALAFVTTVDMIRLLRARARTTVYRVSPNTESEPSQLLLVLPLGYSNLAFYGHAWQLHTVHVQADPVPGGVVLYKVGIGSHHCHFAYIGQTQEVIYFPKDGRGPRKRRMDTPIPEQDTQETDSEYERVRSMMRRHGQEEDIVTFFVGGVPENPVTIRSRPDGGYQGDFHPQRDDFNPGDFELGMFHQDPRSDSESDGEHEDVPMTNGFHEHHSSDEVEEEPEQDFRLAWWPRSLPAAFTDMPLMGPNPGDPEPPIQARSLGL